MRKIVRSYANENLIILAVPDKLMLIRSENMEVNCSQVELNDDTMMLIACCS